MSKLAQVSFTGMVIFMMTIPVLFSQNAKHVLQEVKLRSGHPLGHPINDPVNLFSKNDLKITFHQNYISPFAFNFVRLPSLRDTMVKIDTNMKIDTLGKTNKLKTNKFRMKKSPWLAVGFSAVLPGAGQFYNQSYWKVPVVLGLCGYFGWQVYDNNKQFLDYRDRYAASQTPENGYNGNLNLKSLREFYRNQRDDFIWYFTIAYVVNLIDAYIDAHLFDFDVKEEKFTQFGKTDIKHSLNIRIKF